MSDQIVSAGWENYKSLPDGELDFSNADSLLLEGPNGAGKTSVVQVLSMLAREDESEEPLKHGEEKGQYWVKALKGGSEWLIRRVFNADGRDSYLVKQDGEAAKTEDGRRLNPSKKWFREFFNAPSFDPFAITGRKMKDMVDELFLLADYDASRFDQKIQEIYDKRHEVGVLRKMKDGHINDLGVDSEDVLKYTEEVNVVDVISELTEARQHQKRIDQEKEAVAEAYSAMMELGRQKESKEAQIERLKKELEEINEKGAKAKEKWGEKKAKVASLESNVPDIGSLEDRVASAEDHNKKVGLVKQYLKARDEWEQADKDWKEYDEKLTEVRDQKIQEVMNLKFVDPNLFISCEEKDGKVIYQVRYRTESGDVPFQEGDINTAKLIEVGIRLKLEAMKRLDQFPVLRLDCSAMDQTTIEQVVDMLASEGVFGVLEKAIGRQGVDTLQYKLIESGVNKVDRVTSAKAMADEVDQEVIVHKGKPSDELADTSAFESKQNPGDIDLTKMFDGDDETAF